MAPASVPVLVSVVAAGFDFTLGQADTVQAVPLDLWAGGGKAALLAENAGAGLGVPGLVTFAAKFLLALAVTLLGVPTFYGPLALDRTWFFIARWLATAITRIPTILRAPFSRLLTQIGLNTLTRFRIKSQ